MIVKCPVCDAECECAPGECRCDCGAKFSVDDEGRVTTGGEPPPFSDDDPLSKTIPPRRHEEYDSAADVTMPGRRERKPDGRFVPGDVIMARYEVLSELGQGGMGVVYKCFDRTGGIEVALKALPPELSHNTLEMEDIRDNFQLVAKLVHQNIAINRNLERDNSNGNYYLIMECVEGEDLRRWIKRKRRESGGLKLDDVLPVVRQVAAALDYAHKEGVIHRDIKPGNIMIAPDGTIKILDFGLAAQIHTSMTRVSMAYRGTSGTGPYMAPEQWRGRAQGAAADQYALAVMTYEMLAGHLPFESTDVAVLQQAVLTQTADAVPHLPKYAQAALRRAMSKEPLERFSNCSDFTAALAGKPVAGAKKRLGSVGWFLLAAVILLAVLGGGGYGYYRQVEKRRAEERRKPDEQKRRAEQAKAAKLQADAAAKEQQRRAEERRKLDEQKRRAEQAKAAKLQADAAAKEQQRLAEERRKLDEQKRRAEQAKVAKLQADAAEKEQQRLAEEERQRKIAEKKRQAAVDAQRKNLEREAGSSFDRRDFAGALKLYRQIDPPSPVVLFRMAQCQLELGERELAMKSLIRASSAGHYDPDCTLARQYGRSGRWQDALDGYETALKHDGNNVLALSQAAIICLYGRNGRPDVARGFEYLKRAAELGDPKSMYNLGCCYAHFRGVDFDGIVFSRENAVRWLKKARAAGIAAAAEKLRELGE